MEVLYEVYMYMEQVEILNCDELGAKTLPLDTCISIGWAGKLGEQNYASTFLKLLLGFVPKLFGHQLLCFWTKILTKNSKYLNSINTCDIIKYLVNCVNTIL